MYSVAKSICSRGGGSSTRFIVSRSIGVGGDGVDCFFRSQRRRQRQRQRLYHGGDNIDTESFRMPHSGIRATSSSPKTTTISTSTRFLSTFPTRPRQQLRRLQNCNSLGSNRDRRRQRQQRRTMMARSSVHAAGQDPSLDPEAKAMTFLVGTLGHDRDVAKGVLDALKQSGVSGGPALLSMVRTLAGRWEVDEDAGLEALVESVTVELARSKGKEVVSVWILPASAWASKEDDDPVEVKDDFKRAFKVEGFEDMSLTDVAKFGDGEGADVLGEMIECSCSGIMACSTCHVVVHSDWFEKVGKPTEAEEDMIDLAYNQQETSRLGCQVILKPNLQNAIFKIPRGANNMMDFIPFEDD